MVCVGVAAPTVHSAAASAPAAAAPTWRAVLCLGVLLLPTVHACDCDDCPDSNLYNIISGSYLRYDKSCPVGSIAVVGALKAASM